LLALNSSDCRCKVGHAPRTYGGNPRNIVRHFQVLDSIKSNALVAMAVAAASRRIAGSIVVDLTLEDMEGSIGRFFQ
jgi:hypothetical protein